MAFEEKVEFFAKQVDEHGYEIDIAFDPSLFEVLSVTPGDFLSQGVQSNTYWVDPQIDNLPGSINNIVEVRLTPGITVSGSGTLAVIEIRDMNK